jgi:hypothetical protein
MENLAGIGGLKPTLQSVRLRVFLKLRSFALLRKTALIISAPEIIIILLMGSKYKDLQEWISR